jgi:hypothetical protein
VFEFPVFASSCGRCEVAPAEVSCAQCGVSMCDKAWGGDRSSDAAVLTTPPQASGHEASRNHPNRTPPRSNCRNANPPPPLRIAW